jgi:leucyl aminopeptidase
MSQLRTLGCRSAVTGYLMCTDNMPSGSAMQLGDVLTIYGGTTVEVLNTDAEGRLVMADALVLAREEPLDAIVDIATLTGACLRTFGTEVAGVLGNSPALVEQLRAAAAAADEPVWQLPLEHRYRDQLNSEIADLTNMGGINAGSITAALFLEEFVGSVPWAHLDIAGTAWAGHLRRLDHQGCHRLRRPAAPQLHARLHRTPGRELRWTLCWVHWPRRNWPWSARSTRTGWPGWTRTP